MSNVNNFGTENNGDDYGAYRPGGKNEEFVEETEETVGMENAPLFSSGDDNPELRESFDEVNQRLFGQQPPMKDANYAQPNFNQPPVNNSYNGNYNQPNYNQQANYEPQPNYNQYPVNNSYNGNYNLEWSPKSKLAAGLFGIFLGSLGVHNFYLGFTGKAVAQLLLSLLTLGILSPLVAIWGMIEGILILSSTVGTKWDLDADGRALPPIGN